LLVSFRKCFKNIFLVDVRSTQHTKTPKVDGTFGYLPIIECYNIGCHLMLHLQQWVAYFFMSTLWVFTPNASSYNIGLRTKQYTLRSTFGKYTQRFPHQCWVVKTSMFQCKHWVTWTPSLSLLGIRIPINSYPCQCWVVEYNFCFKVSIIWVKI